MANHIIYRPQSNSITRSAAITATRDLENLLDIPSGPPLVLDFNNTQGYNKLVVETRISRPFAATFTQRNRNFANGPAIGVAVNVGVNGQNAGSINILQVLVSGGPNETFFFEFKMLELRQLSNNKTLVANLGLVNGRICLIILKNPLGDVLWPAPAVANMAAAVAPTRASGGVKLP